MRVKRSGGVGDGWCVAVPVDSDDDTGWCCRTCINLSGH
jgi:hypothetical protein